MSKIRHKIFSRIFTETEPFLPLMGVLVLNPASITIDGSIHDSLAYSEDMKRRAKKFSYFQTRALRADIEQQKTDSSRMLVLLVAIISQPLLKNTGK